MDPGRFGNQRDTPLPVGAAAPSFTLRHTFEQSFAFPSGRPVVLAFYVFDFGRF